MGNNDPKEKAGLKSQNTINNIQSFHYNQLSKIFINN